MNVQMKRYMERGPKGSQAQSFYSCGVGVSHAPSHNQPGRMIDKIFPIGGGTENSSSLKTVVSSGAGDGRWGVGGKQTLPSSSLGTREDSAH